MHERAERLVGSLVTADLELEREFEARLSDSSRLAFRVAYSVLDSPGLTYHHASMQIIEEAPGRCRFVWTTDFLPAEAANDLRGLIEAGTAALKTNLERVGHHARAGRS